MIGVFDKSLKEQFIAGKRKKRVGGIKASEKIVCRIKIYSLCEINIYNITECDVVLTSHLGDDMLLKI